MRSTLNEPCDYEFLLLFKIVAVHAEFLCFRFHMDIARLCLDRKASLFMTHWESVFMVDDLQSC